jgi:NNP family nitrate/nitrite transporter-like MFS transporter
VGSLARPIGGWLADRFGGARVTVIDFFLMGLGIAAVAMAVNAKVWNAFLAAFLFVFATTGIGNGSTYRMIPAIFRTQALTEVNPVDTEAVSRATTRGRRDAAAAIGICSAVGALGGVLIQQAFRISLEQTKSIGPALIGLAVFYGVCVVLTWFCYMRRRVAVSVVPSLAGAGV